MAIISYKTSSASAPQLLQSISNATDRMLPLKAKSNHVYTVGHNQELPSSCKWKHLWPSSSLFPDLLHLRGHCPWTFFLQRCTWVTPSCQLREGLPASPCPLSSPLFSYFTFVYGIIIIWYTVYFSINLVCYITKLELKGMSFCLFCFLFHVHSCHHQEPKTMCLV